MHARVATQVYIDGTNGPADTDVRLSARYRPRNPVCI